MFSTNRIKKIEVKEIDILLERWIPVNTIIRAEVRDAIVKEIEKQRTEERIKILTWENRLKK
tara:strand:- start:1303 stop:1488 length:186 start_codon:yes stop_codon:yes gene_type:complete